MATKNFAQMTTKKLNALLATVSEEDKAAIQAVLATREQSAFSKPVEFEDEKPLTEEEQAILDAAEANGGINPMYNGSAGEKKPKLSDEELDALAEELKSNINHRCQVVPFNTAEWVDGHIAGVVKEKRSGKILYAIKTDDGRRIVKVHDSNLLRVLGEVIEPKKKARARKVKETIEWTPEAIAQEVSAASCNVGKTIELEKYRTIDDNGEEQVEMVTGRIIGIVPEKRTRRLLYRISVPAPTEEAPTATKIVHKVVAPELSIAEEFDAEGKEFNDKYLARREASAARTPMTPQSRYMKCEENLKKAEEKLQKAQEELNAKKQALEEAKKELDAYLATQASTEESLA